MERKQEHFERVENYNQDGEAMPAIVLLANINEYKLKLMKKEHRLESISNARSLVLWNVKWNWQIPDHTATMRRHKPPR